MGNFTISSACLWSHFNEKESKIREKKGDSKERTRWCRQEVSEVSQPTESEKW
jgi:hypothetical protein